MFSKKPIPPHCENLTDAQVKLVRKILALSRENYMFPTTACADFVETVLKKSWPDVLVAVAKNETLPIAPYKSGFFEAALLKCETACVVAVHTHLTGLNETDHATLLARDVARLNDEAARLIIESQVSPRIRAATAAELLKRARFDHALEERVVQLFLPPTDLHYEAGELMKFALFFKRFAIADAWRANGFDLAYYTEDIRTFLIERKAPHDARLYLDEHAPQQIAFTPVIGLPAAEHEQVYLRSGDCVSRSDLLPDGGSLTTVFNFSSQQQIVVAHIAGQTSQPVITSFSHIEGREALMEAAAAFIQQDGSPLLVQHIAAMPSGRPVLIAKTARRDENVPSSTIT